jgi:hypothetical protein
MLMLSALGLGTFFLGTDHLDLGFSFAFTGSKKREMEHGNTGYRDICARDIWNLADF